MGMTEDLTLCPTCEESSGNMPEGPEEMGAHYGMGPCDPILVGQRWVK